MKVIVVGAGIAGLSLAISLSKHDHHVVLLESASHLAELGAGIQMTPQAVKYLMQWGLGPDIVASSIVPNRMYIRHWKDGTVVGTTHVDEMEERYGAPYIVTHRSVLHSVLHKHAVAAGAEVMLDSRVVKYDFADGAVELHNGQRLSADLVVAADGINSSARAQLLGPQDPGSRPTGWAAFRMSADMAKIKNDPVVSSVVGLTTGSSNFWIAPDISCMTYLVKDATMLNIVLSHRDDIDTRDFTLEEYRGAVDELYKDFDFPVHRLLDISEPKIANFPVYEVPPLPRWIHDSGRFSLIGDSAHAMAFFLSMGVSLAVEDAAALCAVLNHVENESRRPTDSSTLTNGNGDQSSKVDFNVLATSMQAYQRARSRRVLAVQRASLHAGETLHVQDGAGRDELYAALRCSHDEMLSVSASSIKTTQLAAGQPERCGPGGISDKTTRDWCYDFDAIGDVMASLGSVNTK